jgi:hypothetical protein
MKRNVFIDKRIHNVMLHFSSLAKTYQINPSLALLIDIDDVGCRCGWFGDLVLAR